MPVHLVVEPFSCILFAVAPYVGTSSTNFIHLEVTIVNGAISEGKLSFSIFLSFAVLAFVNGTIGPCFNAETVLFVISPIALVSRPVCMSVGAFAVSLIILPFAFINVTIRVKQLSKPVCLVVKPVALVAGAIWPFLPAETLSELISPFTFVNGATWEGNRALRDLGSLESAYIIRMMLIVIRIFVFKVIVVMFMSRSHADVTGTIRGISKRCIIDIVILLISSQSFLHVFLIDLLDNLVLRIFAHARTKYAGTVTHFSFIL